MLKFREFIAEEYLIEEAPVSSNTGGVLHELLVGFHLRGGKHMDRYPNIDRETPQQAHDRLKKTVSPKQYEKIYKRAKAAAHNLRERVGGNVHDVHWTSKEGDIERSTGIPSTQDEDAGDVVIHTKKGKKTTYHSVSLKVTDKKSGNVPVSNPGMELTHGGGEILTKHRNKIKKRFPRIASLPNKASRKEYLAKNPKINKEIRAQNTKVLTDIVGHLEGKLSEMSHGELVKHIRHIIKANPTPMQRQGHHHIRHTTYGDNSFNTVDPTKSHEHILKDPKNISFERRGTSIVFKYKGKAFARHRMKFESQSDPLSSIKGSGELIGNH